MRDALDRCSWPARRWLVDRLVGQHAYSRHVGPSGAWTFIDYTTSSGNQTTTQVRPIVFDFTAQPSRSRRSAAKFYGGSRRGKAS